MPDLNWLAIVAAAVSAFLLGGLWYGPLFKNAWCREAGYVHIKKLPFEGRSRTWVQQTVSGRRAFVAHLAALRALAEPS